MIDGKPLILGRPHVMSPAHSWLRIEQHLHEMERQGLAICPMMLEGQDDAELGWKAKCLADCFVSSSEPNDKLFWLVDQWTSMGKPWVWDQDDDPLTISPFNDAYKMFGTSEVTFEELGAQPMEGRPHLWKDGVGGFHLDENVKRHERYMKMLREQVSAISTTTEYLAAKIRKIAPDTPILIRPNVLDFNHIWTRTRRPTYDGRIRIMYQGGSSHRADLVWIKEPLREIARAYPHVTFCFHGDTKQFASEFIPEDQIEEFTWIAHYPTFALRMAELGPNIGIAPLSQDPLQAEFNRCKSALKWLDYAAVGVPCVCEWATPYQEVVNFGQAADKDVNGLLAKTVDDWYHCLAMLIENEEMREVVGRNALDDAFQNWNVEHYAHDYLAQYEEVLNGHNQSEDAPAEVGGEVR